MKQLKSPDIKKILIHVTLTKRADASRKFCDAAGCGVKRQ